MTTRWRIAARLILTVAITVAQTFAAEPPTRIVGGCFSYRAVRGDYLYRIGGRFGLPPTTLAAINGFDNEHRLRIGEELTVCNQHLVPQDLNEGILINIPQRMLFWFQNGALLAAYPVAVGRPGWKTPTGTFHVRTKVTDPTWFVPTSIQEEMEAKGQPIRQSVPPSAENPLGKHWIGLDVAGFGMHGTNAAASIHRFQTHGCIRLLPEHVADLYAKVPIGTAVIIIYQPLLLAEVQGAVYLEVHPDPYRQLSTTAEQTVASLAQQGGFQPVNWQLVRTELQRSSGLARNVTLR